MVSRRRLIIATAGLTIFGVISLGVINRTPQPVQAQSTTPRDVTLLANSSGETELNAPTDQKSLWISYFRYDDLLTNINWPLRAPDCPPAVGSNTIRKTLPWLAATDTLPQVVQITPPYNNGNTITTVSNCANRYHDGGQSNQSGAWLRGTAYGGWVNKNFIDHNSWGPIFRTENANVSTGGGIRLDSAILKNCWYSDASDCPKAVWGDNKVFGQDCSDTYFTQIVIQPDQNPCQTNLEQNPRFETVEMFKRNGYSNYAADQHNGSDVFLSTNGTTLIRNEFTISAQEWQQYQGIDVRLCIKADDWFRVWINGFTVGTSTLSGSQYCMDQIYDLIDQGKNVIAIQVADKARWSNDYQTPSQASGVIYDLVVMLPNDGDGGGDPDPDPDPNIVDCPPFPNVSVEENLSNGAPNTSAPSGYGSRNSVYEEHNPQGEFRVTSVEDISYGSDNVSIPYSPTSKSSFSGSPDVTLDYKPFFNRYPYDDNQARVHYRSYYDTVRWTATGDRVYGPWYTYCVMWGDIDPGPRYEWGCRVDTQRRDVIGYEWERGSTTRNRYVTNQHDADLMPYCFPRSVTTESGSPSLGTEIFDDLEDPSNLTYTGDLALRFNLEYGHSRRLRKPFSVNNLQVNANFNITRWNGSSFALPSSSPLTRISGNIPGGQTLTRSVSGTVPSAGVTTAQSLQAVFGARIPPLQPGDRGCFAMGMPRSQANISPDGVILSSHPAGLTRSSPSARGSTPSSECGSVLHNKPYVKVFGGSVTAGSRFSTGSTCTTPGTGIISTYARYNGGTPFGSSAQFAAEALNAISGNTTDSGFFSNSSRSSSSQYDFLSIGNTSGVWGGLSGNSRCLVDFYDEQAEVTRLSDSLPPPPVTGGKVRLNSIANGQYQTSGDINIGTTSGIPDGKRVTIYVNGDAIIQDNILYDGSYAYNPTLENAYENIPYITIVARGNIYVQAGVSAISGLYIAQPMPNGTRGEIYTCAIGKATPTDRFDNCTGTGNETTTAARLTARCNGGNSNSTTVGGVPLTVYGSFVARHVFFERSNGSLRCAKPGGAANAHVASPETIDTPSAAEKFIQIPEMTLGRPLFKPRTSASSNDFGGAHSYTSLPPIF